MQSLPQEITTLIIPSGGIPGQPGVIVIDGNTGNITVYGQADSHGDIPSIFISPNTLGVPEIAFETNAPNEKQSGLINTFVFNPGATNEYEGMVIFGPEGPVDQARFYVDMVNTSADGITQLASFFVAYELVNLSAAYNVIIANAQGAQIIGFINAQQPGQSVPTVEVWNAISLLNGWVNTGSTNATAQYKMSGLGNFVHVVGDIKSGTITNGTIIGNIPVPYRPVNNQQLVITVVAGSTSAPFDTALATITASGNLVLDNLPTGTNRIALNGMYSLDA